jgi:SnoaL-like domain
MRTAPIEQVLQDFYAAFAETDRARRAELLARCLTPDAEITWPGEGFKGHAEISRKIDGFHQRWAGARLVLTSGWNAYRNIVRVAGAIVDAHGVALAESHSVFELADDGRIARVWPFWEPLPALPDAWPAELSKRWASV